MATTRKPAETRSIEELLTELTEPVQYDVARGLERHQRLVAAQTPLPEWARPDADRQLVPSAQARRFRKRGWWVVWSLSLGSTVWLAATSGRELESGQPQQTAPHESHTPAATSERGTAPASAPELRARSTRGKLDAASIQKTRSPGEPIAVQLPERAQTERAREVEPIAARNPTLEAAQQAPHATDSAGRTEATEGARDALPDSVRTPQAAARSTPARAAPKTRTRSLPNGSSRGAAGRGQPNAGSPLDAEEMRQLNQAEQLLAPAPLQTLKLVREGEVTFRGGYFSQERRYLEVMALFALGRRDEAQSHAEWFLRDYPDGPYRQKVELALVRHAPR